VPYTEPYQALIMASLVEKETGVPQERGQIAGVFVRRMAIGMLLQTDPTVIYGLGDRYSGKLTRAHLKEPTPYNTYVIPGLPPTPIAMVGREAIHAALNPVEGNSLYFVARGDGSHVFSDDLDAHNSAVREFQLKRRADYRSSPAPVLRPRRCKLRRGGTRIAQGCRRSGTDPALRNTLPRLLPQCRRKNPRLNLHPPEPDATAPQNSPQ
jgi:UPF0755 protein